MVTFTYFIGNKRYNINGVTNMQVRYTNEYISQNPTPISVLVCFNVKDGYQQALEKLFDMVAERKVQPIQFVIQDLENENNYSRFLGAPIIWGIKNTAESTCSVEIAIHEY